MTTSPPGTVSRYELTARSDIAAIDLLMALEGRELVDIGCGPGLLARELCARGATVQAVEPDPVQAARNREAADLPGLRFVEAPAQALPLAPSSVDGVFFFRSLHHVPADLMDSALIEAARILRPEGFLCVVEPGMTGSHFAMMRPFHDETRVRIAAQDALARTAARLFSRTRLYSYVQYPRYASFAAMAAQFLGNSFNDIRREQVETDEVRELFALGSPDADGHIFEQPMLLNLYTGKR